MIIRTDLMDYCTTDRQREHYQAMIVAQSYSKAARVLGITRGAITETYEKLLARESRGGVYSPATNEIKPFGSKQAELVSKHISTKPKARYVITSAQNATPVFKAGLDSLRLYCRENAAELIVVPNRYHNPTSSWTTADEKQDKWHKWIEFGDALLDAREAVRIARLDQ